MENIVLKKKPVVINTIIMLLAVCLQAIAKLFILPKNVEYTILKFISVYLISIMFVYLFGVCSESFFVLETFKGFYHCQMSYLVIVFTLFSIVLHATDKLNHFVIEADQRNFYLFNNMPQEKVNERINIILYSVEAFQVFYLIYSVYYYKITKKFIEDLKMIELKEFEEFTLMEQGIMAEIIEEDENRTFVNEDQDIQMINSPEDLTYTNNNSMEKSKSLEFSYASRNGR